MKGDHQHFANHQPVDLDVFQRRAHPIAQARQLAAREMEECEIEEAEADHSYRKVKSLRLAKHRSDGLTVTEAVIHAEADAADHKLKRDTAHALRRAAEERVSQLERNASMLRTEVQLSAEAA